MAPTVLSAIFQEHLIQEGIALKFFTALLKTWLAEREASAVWAALKRAGVAGRLIELMPSAERTLDHFKNHFTEAGLEQVGFYRRSYQYTMVQNSEKHRQNSHQIIHCPTSKRVSEVSE